MLDKGGLSMIIFVLIIYIVGKEVCGVVFLIIIWVRFWYKIKRLFIGFKNFFDFFIIFLFFMKKLFIFLDIYWKLLVV